jgi:hypothetical protein
MMIGEIGGTAEEEAAAYIKRTSPSRWSASSAARPRRRRGAWGTPGAIIAGGKGTAAEKMKAMQPPASRPQESRPTGRHRGPCARQGPRGSYGPIERTLTIIQPDCGSPEAIVQIIARFRSAPALKVLGAKHVRLSPEARRSGFYCLHKRGRSFATYCAVQDSRVR